MDDIVDRIRKDLERVKARETEVVRSEEALKAEIATTKANNAALDESRLEYERKLEALEKEKLTMSRGEVSHEDIIVLNVQGEIFSTLRGTLTQFPETRLTYMFNGRWKDNLQKDKDGHVFLDVPPVLFRKMLDYLTTRRMAGSDAIPFPDVPSVQLPQFRLMLRFFEIDACVFSKMSCFSNYLKSSFIELSTDACTATNVSHGMGYVLGHDVYENEVVTFEIEIVHLENPWMFFGIVGEDGTGKSTITDCSFNGNPHAYGWADKGGFWKAGKRQPPSACTIPLEVLHQGQIVEMVLDAQTLPHSLTIKVLPEGHVQEIKDLPSNQEWRLHINLVSCNDAVRLVKAERSCGNA